jgi:hypothetical protein
MSRTAKRPQPTPRKTSASAPALEKQIHLLRLGAIRLNGDTNQRQSGRNVNASVVADYRMVYESQPSAMPMMTVFKDISTISTTRKGHVTYWLVDGFHRHRAALDAGIEELACEVYEGTLDDARWFSCSANQTHGIQRTNADKVKAVRTALLHPQGAKKSDRAIAQHCGVSHTFVANIRAELSATGNGCQSDKREGLDGRTISVAKRQPAAPPIRKKMSEDEFIARLTHIEDVAKAKQDRVDGVGQQPDAPSCEFAPEDVFEISPAVNGEQTRSKPFDFAEFLGDTYIWNIDHEKLWPKDQSRESICQMYLRLAQESLGSRDAFIKFVSDKLKEWAAQAGEADA